MVKQGVSMTQVHVMWRLEESGELAMSRLADFLDVSLSNATGLVDRMEERGLIERLRDHEDRRVVLVRLTQVGTDLLDEIQIMKRDLVTAVLERLDDERLDRLHVALIDFRAAVRAEEIEHPDRFGIYHEHLRHEESAGTQGRESSKP
jgi:DNA-binding MarR family transcriptional regulator